MIKENSLVCCVLYFYLLIVFVHMRCLNSKLTKSVQFILRLHGMLKPVIVVVSLQLLVTRSSITFVTDEQFLRQYSAIF